MANKNKQVDSYIEKSADFAKPVMNHLRELIHRTCPDVEEKMKWSFPHFDYKDEMMCSMASFKQHCAFGFWKASLIKNSAKLFPKTGKTAMGQLGQIKTLKDLPADKVLIACIKEAMNLNDKGIKVERSAPVKNLEIVIPLYFKKALKTNPKAFKAFENFSPSHKREYIDWITEAKTEQTRNRRLDTALEWLAEGKPRNWKYMKK